MPTYYDCNCDPIPLIMRSSRSGEQTHKHYDDSEGTHHAILLDGIEIGCKVISPSQARIDAKAAILTAHNAAEALQLTEEARRVVLVAKLVADTITADEQKELLKINNGVWSPP